MSRQVQIYLSNDLADRYLLLQCGSAHSKVVQKVSNRFLGGFAHQRIDLAEEFGDVLQMLHHPGHMAHSILKDLANFILKIIGLATTRKNLARATY